MNNRGQSAIVLAILALVVGIFAFMVIYGMNSRQNYELANTIAESVAVSDLEVEDMHMESIEHAVKRHGAIVYSVVKYCNSHSGNAQAHLHLDSPTGPRDAWICFFPDDDQWWIVIEGQEIEGDNIVTAFPRQAAKILDDVVEYLKRGGYVQQ